MRLAPVLLPRGIHRSSSRIPSIERQALFISRSVPDVAPLAMEFRWLFLHPQTIHCGTHQYLSYLLPSLKLSSHFFQCHGVVTRGPTLPLGRQWATSVPQGPHKSLWSHISTRFPAICARFDEVRVHRDVRRIGEPQSHERQCHRCSSQGNNLSITNALPLLPNVRHLNIFNPLMHQSRSPRAIATKGY